MIQVSIIGYMVGGAFLGRAYFDLFYHLVVITVILKVLAKREREPLKKVDTRVAVAQHNTA